MMKAKSIVIQMWGILSTRVKSFLNYFKHPDFNKSLIATVLGVLIAFILNDYWHQVNLNKVTEEKLHLVYLEMQYNSTLVKAVLEEYSHPVITEIFIRRADYSLAISALNDYNIVSFLPNYKLSLLLNYIESLRTVNLFLDEHKDFSFSTQTKSFKSSNDMMEAIKSNAASAIASCNVIHREFEKYFDKDSYNHRKLTELQEEIIKLKNHYLQQSN